MNKDQEIQDLLILLIKEQREAKNEVALWGATLASFLCFIIVILATLLWRLW